MNAVPAPLRLSVAIPVRRNAPDQSLTRLLACLESLNRQTLPPENYEVLLAGDAANALALPPLRYRTRLIPDSRPSSSARACNLAVQAAHSEIVLFLRPDVLASPDCLLLHLKVHDASPRDEYGALGRLDVPAGARTTPWGRLLAASGLFTSQTNLNNGAPYGFEHFSPRNLSLPRRSIVAAGMFDEQLQEPDWGLEMPELGLRLREASVLAFFVQGCAASLQGFPALESVIQSFRRRGADAVRLFLRHPAFRSPGFAPNLVDLHFWSNPPSRLMARVQALQRLLCRFEALPPSAATGAALELASARVNWRDLGALRTRDVLALMEPLERALEEPFREDAAFRAFLFLSALHEILGFFSAPSAASLCSPAPGLPLHQTRSAPAKKAEETCEPLSPQPRGRVLLACNYFWPSVGGTELLVEELGARLVREGFAVDVSCRQNGARTLHARKGMRILDFQCWGRFFDRGMGPDVELYRQRVVSEGYDAVIVLAHPDNWACHLLRDLPSGKRPRLVMMASMNAENLAEWETRGVMPAIRQTLQAADMHITVSEGGADAAVLNEMGLPHIFLPHAVTDETAPVNMRERLGLPPDEPLLVCVGNFWPVKNQLGLLRSMTGAPGRWRLALAGGAAPWLDKRPYFMECWELALSDPRVRMVGPLPPLEAAALIRDADALVLPSLGESAGPLVVLQAMALKTPWIATPQCNAVHDEAGGLIAPLERFPQAVKALLSRPAAARELAALGQEHWKRCFCWERSLGGFISLIEGGADQASFPDLHMPEDLRRRSRALARDIFADVGFAQESGREAAGWIAPPPLPEPK